MTVRELKRLLEVVAEDLPVALAVYGHHYGSEDHKGSHGPLHVVVVGAANGIRRSLFLVVGYDGSIDTYFEVKD